MSKLRNCAHPWRLLSWVDAEPAYAHDVYGMFSPLRINVGELGHAVVTRADNFTLRAVNMPTSSIPAGVEPNDDAAKIIFSAVAKVLDKEPVIDFFVNVSKLASLLRDWPGEATARVMLTEDAIIISTDDVAAIMTLSHPNSAILGDVAKFTQPENILPGWLVDMAEMAMGEDATE